MKRPPTERSNNHVIRLARRVLSLPFVAVAAAWKWAAGRLQGLKSDKTRRGEDQVRQSRARRKLRGLPADHAQAPAKTH